MSGSRQIEQMCKFILQEANEKANEIRIKTEHDFHKDKQLRVIAANKKTDEAFEKRKIQLESDKKVRLCCVALIPHIIFFEQLFCLSCVSSCFLFLGSSSRRGYHDFFYRVELRGSILSHLKIGDAIRA